MRSKTGALGIVIALLAVFGVFWSYHGIRSLVELRPLYVVFYLSASLGCSVIAGLVVVVMRQRQANSTAARTAVSVAGGKTTFSVSGALRWGYWVVFGPAAVAGTALAVGMWTDTLQFPMSDGFAAVLPIVALALAVYSVAALVWLGLGYARFPRVECTADTLSVQGFKVRQQVPWSDIVAVEPVGTNNLSVMLEMADDTSADVTTNWVGPFAPSLAELHRSIVIPADLFAVGAGQLFDFLCFYAANPSARPELDDGRAVGRLRLR
ncbi:hypothetical protein QSJ19_25950 [Gordonia sp. ABSL11-1]|uniref:hypothetical protein n=1 Tax=Gordonia sp. ABSL11-1 TaxID=3053924 RepID=UPI0025747264|nr:hypothetical protein [Gordonia sp. ABSL11-1]MDL9948960.1 hypothetical protein [Gordonia sp. ABSL11-1]